MLELHNLNKIYKLKKTEVHAIKDVNLTMKRGEFVSILGESGSGKTTLLSTIGGMENPTSGSFKIDGIDISSFNQKRWTDYRKNTIGFIFQDFNLIDHLSAKDNVKLALSLSGHSETYKENKAYELLSQVGMSDHMHQFPKQLSGGQQQRVAIARALANDPEIILADEPTGALDSKTSVQIMNILTSLSNSDHLVIMVTHDEELAQSFSSRIVEIDDGKIVKDTQVKESKKCDSPAVDLKKSSLQFMAALKVAFNNLKVRKKSSIFVIASLVPSMVLVLILSNLVYNLLEYQNDIQPIYNNIVNEETVSYLSTLSEGHLERNVRSLILKIEDRNYSEFVVKATEESLYAPFDAGTIAEIEALPEVEAVLKPNYYDVYIDGYPFVLIGLNPEVYKQYQYDFQFDGYPNDNDEGLIISKSVAEKLGYETGEPIHFAINSFNGIALHFEKQREEKNVYYTQILKVFDPEVKSSIMKNYYNGYIFASAGYIQQLRNDFTVDDISIVSYQVAEADDPRAVNSKYIAIGSKNLSDVLLPIRSKFGGVEDVTLFNIRKYSVEVPTNNFAMKYKIITHKAVNDDTIEKLEEFGYYYTSQYDEITVDSAKTTGRDVRRLVLFSKIAIAVVVILPSLLVGLILFISILLRTKEIGVLKSIGAKSKDIVTIFTLESGILAATSGILAIFFTFPAIKYAKQQLEATMNLTETIGFNPLTTNYIALAVALLSIVSLITLLGLLPGRKASKLHPRVLLRKIG